MFPVFSYLCVSHSPNGTRFATSSTTWLPHISPPFSFKTLSAANINRAPRGRTFWGWISLFTMTTVLPDEGIQATVIRAHKGLAREGVQQNVIFPPGAVRPQ